MEFKIIHSKFLEGLASVQNIIAEELRSGMIHVIAEPVGEKHISSSAAFRAGLVEEYNTEHGCNCPICGGRLEYAHGPDWEDILVCEECKSVISNELSESTIYRVSQRNAADLVGKYIGEFGSAQPMGAGNYRLGTVFGRDAYFCAAPKEGFFNSFSKDTLVVTCDDSAVPRGWATNGCMVIRFAELFYEKSGNGDINIGDSVLKRIKDKVGHRRFGKNRVIHKGRNHWLSVIMNILSEKYRESDFRDGKLTGAAAMRWFRKLYPKYRGCARTFSRQMEEFTTYDKENDRYDKREPLIANLLKYLANADTPQADRLKTAKAVAELLEQAKQATRRNGGIPVELPESSWCVSEDGRSERVLTVSENSIIDTVDAHLRGKKREEDAA